MRMAIIAVYGLKGKPVIVCIMSVIVENVSSRSRPLSQKPVCQSSILYMRCMMMMFSVPMIIAWMPYWVNMKKAKPIGGIYSRKEFWKASSSSWIMTSAATSIAPWIRMGLDGLGILSNPFTYLLFCEPAAYPVTVFRAVPVN